MATSGDLDLAIDTALDLTIVEMPELLSGSPAGSTLRRHVMNSIDNTFLKEQWLDYDGMKDGRQFEFAAPLMHRLGSILIYPELRLSFGQSQNGFDLESVIAEGKTLLVPLRKGRVGPEPAALAANLLLSRLWGTVTAADQAKRRPTFLYVDEWYNHTSTQVPFGEMAAEARKYLLGLVLSQHHPQQVSRELQQDVLTNVRSKVTWATVAENARAVAPQFGETVTPSDIENLEAYEAMGRFLVDSQLAPPVTMSTFPMPPEKNAQDLIRAQSRRTYGKPAADVEREIEARKTFHRAATPVTLPDPDEGIETNLGFWRADEADGA